MGACLSAQRDADTESISSARSRMKGTLPRAPLTINGCQEHRPGRPSQAAAVPQSVTSSLKSTLQVQQQLQLPTTNTTKTPTTPAVAAAIGTPLTLDPQAATQSAEPQGTTAPVDGSSAAQDTHEAAAAPYTVDWRLATTATVTLQTPSTFKIKTASGKVSAQAMELSRHNFVPLTLAWTAAERKCTVLKDLCIRLDKKLTKEQAVKHAAVGALAASAKLAADLERQLSTEQESLGAVKEELRGKDDALAEAVAEAARLQRELDEQRGEKEDTERQLSASHAQLGQQEGQLSAAQVQLAEQACQLSAASAQLEQQEVRLGLLPKTMARAAELAGQLAAAEKAAADAKAKLKAERRKGVSLAWMLRKTEHFAQALEALHDNLPHLSEDDLTTIGVLGQGGFARVDHKTVTHADGSTTEVAVKVVLPPEQPAATADTSPCAADASSDASPAPSSAASSEADSAASSEVDSAASSAGDPAPAAACSVAPATCDSDKGEEDGSDTDEDENQDSDIDEDEEDGSETDEDEEEDAEEVDMSEEALQASLKSRALRLEGAVLNKLRGQPCILGAQAWQGEGRTGLVLPLAKGGSLKDLLWPVPGDRSEFVPQDRDQVLRIAGGLCTALLAAHAQGVAHLDVKADNVLLDTDLNVQLADWGTAAPLSFTAAQWRARGIMGSAGLIFPGVLYNPASGGVRHDVYAAGALCYGMLTGRDYAHECWEQYQALPKATHKAIWTEAGERCEALGYSGDPTSMELLMVAQLRGYVRAAQVEQHLRLLGGERMPEPLAPLLCWTQQALCMKTWRACEVTLQDMKSAVFESWQRLHQLA